MFFLKISNANVLFDKKLFMWKFYITNKTLLITKQMQLIDLKKFVIKTLDMSSKIFVMHIAN